MPSVPRSRPTAGGLVALVPALVVLAATAAVGAPAAHARSGGDDARTRAGARCGQGARTRLELRGRDGGIRLDWRLQRGRARERWRVVVVQEGRVAWRGTRAIARGGELRLRLGLRDLAGADHVEVRAGGPRGTSCATDATLRG